MPQPLVFVDSGVILGFLRGDASVAPVFAAERDGRIRFAVNPIVLQELLFGPDAVSKPEFAQIRDHLRVLPLDLAKAEALLPRARALRNRMAHSNDLLEMSSADECDYLVTHDELMKRLAPAGKPRVVTPEELITHLQAA